MFGTELCIIDTAGLRFLVSTPAQTLDKQDRKAIRSHAARANPADRQVPKLRSWISPDRVIGSLRKALLEEALGPESIFSVPSPRGIGTDLSGLQLPPGFDLYMIRDLVKCIRSSLPPPPHPDLFAFQMERQASWHET